MGRHLITSALPYINGVKHLGNLVGSMLPADVYARHMRLRGHDVLFICATDEHGTPAELAADAAGLSVEDYCTEQHEIQAGLARRYGLSFDHFGRSSSPQNAELTRHFAEQHRANGMVEERVTDQVYSLDDERFLPDRYIIGTCPHCGYERANGDQCENCARLLEPSDLINPRSAISGSTRLEVRATRHLFIRQSLMADRVREWIDSHSDWPILVTSIARNWLDEGLDDRSITRDLKWGVPVEWPGFEDKVYYVWFDAPIEYIGATKEWADARGLPDEWRSWWYEANDVTYVQFMAKDNVPFHTVGFPCTLIGSREPWKLVDHLKAFNWLTYYGGKFSTSGGVGVFMDDALELLPADYWRYYLMSNAPESDDASFSWEGLASIVNKDLADTFGNFVNRTLSFSSRRFGDAVPAGGAVGPPEEELAGELEGAIRDYSQLLSAREFRKAMQALRTIWTRGNAYFDSKEPWVTVKVDRDETAVTLRTSINLIVLFARLAAPVLPGTACLVLDSLAVDREQRGWPKGAEIEVLQPGDEFHVPDVLFRKLSDADVEKWRERFGGDADPSASGT